MTQVSTDSSKHGNTKMLPELTKYLNHKEDGLQINQLDL
jgi:hypothetical protein